MNINIASELEDFFENQNFTISEAERYDDGRAILTVQQYTPEGEDWHTTFELGDGTYRDLIKDVKETSAYFDVDEEVEVWLEFRGTHGVPSSIRALVEDAEWKETTLQNLANAIEEEFESIKTRSTIIDDLPLEKLSDSSVIELYDEGESNNIEPYYEQNGINWYMRTEDADLQNSIINKADFCYTNIIEDIEEYSIPENLFDIEYLYSEIAITISADESIDLYVMLKLDGEMIADKEIKLNEEETKALRNGVDGFLKENGMPSVKEYLKDLEKSNSKKKTTKEFTDD